MKNRLRVAVLFGGKSSEYEVSLRSAAFVLSSLDPEKYEAIPVGITRQGIWKLYTGDRTAIPTDQWDSPELPEVWVRPGCSDAPFASVKDGVLTPFSLDVAFPVLHGKNGEDGTVQGLLQLAGVPCVGPDCGASAVCMNKAYTHRVLDAAGIPNAPWECVRETVLNEFDAMEQRVATHFGYPMFIKPARAGSSVGVSKAHNAEELRVALVTAFREDSLVLIEGLLRGAEVECSVLGNGSDLFATAPAEILSADEFYDYASKYNDIGSEVIIPARLNPTLTEAVRETARRTYRALYCAGMSRVDMFAADDGTVYVNEVNTIPGFTAISGYPKMMEYEKIGGRELCSRLIDLALAARN